MSAASNDRSRTSPGNALVRAVVAAISDEALRHIADSKDISTCRARIRAAAIIAHASLSKVKEGSGPSNEGGAQ